MTDNQPNPSYQDILDKYAESINSKEDHQIPEEKIKPEPELEPINPPESILTPEEEEVIKSQPPVEAEETPLNPPEAVLNPPQIEAPPTPEAINSPPVAEAIISPPPQIELPPESSEISPKKPNHFFKYLFFFSLIIFIVVLVLVVISFLNSQKPVSNSRDIPQNNFSPTSLPTDFCELNNQQYLVGATFTADDGCNTCTCGEDLTVTCTTNTCDLTPTADWKTYENKEYGFSFKYPTNFQPSSQIQIIDNSDQLTVKQYSDNLVRESKNDELCPGCYRVINEEKYSIGVNTALLQEVVSHPIGRTIKFLVSNKNKIIILRGNSIGDSDTPTSDSTKEEFLKILSTFKFTP